MRRPRPARARYAAMASARCVSRRSADSGCAYKKERAARKLLRRAARDEITEEREGAAGKADERHAAWCVRRAPASSVSSTNGTSRSRHQLPPAHRSARRVRIGSRTTGPGSKVRSIAHALQRRHDVAEENGGIELEAPQRLQSHLGCKLRRARQFDEVDLRAKLAVLRQIAPGLAHDPDGRVGGAAGGGRRPEKRSL